MSKFIPRKDVMREMIRQDVVRKRLIKEQKPKDCKDVANGDRNKVIEQPPDDAA